MIQKTKENAPVEEKIKKIKAMLSRESAAAEDTQETRTLYDQSRFGEPIEGRFVYSLCEALYLVEKKRMDLVDNKKKKVSADQFLQRARKGEKNFWVRYAAYKDMRSRGYIVKTALKFGADFRIYDRGVKPGEDHAKWIMYPLHEGESMTLYEFSAKNRVAHSTKKQLLLAIVDDEGDVSYWQVMWTRP